MSRRVLIAGGGVAALEGALALQALAEERTSVELLAPEPRFWYRPLAVTEPFGLGDARHFELPELAAAAGATFTPGTLVAVDAERHLAHTSAGNALEYDFLLVACGALPVASLPGALTFRGPADRDKLRRLLDEIQAGSVRRVAFAVPAGTVWSLPAYELALLTATYLEAREVRDVELTLTTPEKAPLQVFGPAASDALRELLAERGVAVRTSAYPSEVRNGALRLVPDGAIEIDRVVALPRLRGPRIDGLPQTLDGFVPVDTHGRVMRLPDVFAAGDITNFPVKQGGIAAQQAVAAAQTIAVAAGAGLTPRPFRPVLRGLLLTGSRPRYLRREITGASAEGSLASPEPLWWPPAKIAGHYIAPFLARLAGVESPREVPAPRHATRVEVELDPEQLDRLTARRSERMGIGDGDGDITVAEIMSAEPLVVAPEDTLGQVAEEMQRSDVGSAAVGDAGRLIGILTSRDLLRAFAGRVHSSEARAREWMTAEPVAVPPDTSVDDAVTLMTEHGIHHLPVVEGERVVGMVGLRGAVREARWRTGIGLGL